MKPLFLLKISYRKIDILRRLRSVMKNISIYVYNIRNIYCAIMNKKELLARNIYFAYLYNIDVTFREYLLLSW